MTIYSEAKILKTGGAKLGVMNSNCIGVEQPELAAQLFLQIDLLHIAVRDEMPIYMVKEDEKFEIYRRYISIFPHCLR